MNIALNKISGEWDAEKLADLFDELKIADALDFTGFDGSEIDILLAKENYIDDLLNDDFVNMQTNPSEFSMTFIFPLEYRGDIEKYIKENGKGAVVEMIMNKIKGAI